VYPVINFQAIPTRFSTTPEMLRIGEDAKVTGGGCALQTQRPLIFHGETNSLRGQICGWGHRVPCKGAPLKKGTITILTLTDTVMIDFQFRVEKCGKVVNDDIRL
jgi:hypothetical protein